jgi:hypothetical protein
MVKFKTRTFCNFWLNLLATFWEKVEPKIYYETWLNLKHVRFVIFGSTFFQKVVGCRL